MEEACLDGRIRYESPWVKGKRFIYYGEAGRWKNRAKEWSAARRKTERERRGGIKRRSLKEETDTCRGRG